MRGIKDVSATSALDDPRIKALRPWPPWAPGPEGLSDEDRAELYERLWSEYDEAVRRRAMWERRLVITTIVLGAAVVAAAAFYELWLSPRRHEDDPDEGQHCQQEAGDHERPPEQRASAVLGDQPLLLACIDDLGNGWDPHPEAEPEEKPAEGELHDAPAKCWVLHPDRGRDERRSGDVGEGDPPSVRGRDQGLGIGHVSILSRCHDTRASRDPEAT